MQKRTIRKNKIAGQFMKMAALSILAIVIVYYFIIGKYGLITQLRLANQQRAASQKIETLKKQQKDLKKKIDRLAEDAAYQEKIARERYKLARKGETIYLMVPKKEKSQKKPSNRP